MDAKHSESDATFAEQEGQADQGQSAYPHPLLNDLILCKIFSKLSLPSLLDCRQVCKTWLRNSALVASIQQCTTIHLNSYEKLEAFLQFLEGWDPFLLSNGSRTFPVTHYFLHFTSQCHSLCDSDHILDAEEEERALLGRGKLRQLLTLLKEKGLAIKYLKLLLDKTHLDKEGLETLLSAHPELEILYIYNLSHRAVFSQGLEREDFHLPNLRSLIMDEIRIPVTPFLSSFLQLCPNLEEIEIKCDKRSDWDNQKGIWKEHSPLATSVIKALSLGPSILKLKSLKCGVLDLSHFLLLTELGKRKSLKLNKLEMYCPAKDVSSEVIREFLCTQSDSLRELKVLGNVEKLRRSVGYNQGQGQQLLPLLPETELDFPGRMESLSLLQLSGRDKDTPIPVKGRLYYSLMFPTIRTLIVNGFASNILDRMNSYFPFFYAKPCFSLRKLVLPAEVRDPSFPGGLAQLFPNLEELEVKYPDGEFLKAVFSNLGGLKTLKILAEQGLSLDDALIGVDDEIGLNALKDLRELDITVETEHTQVPKALSEAALLRTLPSLRKLRRLTLLSCCWFDGVFPCNFISLERQADLRNSLDSCVLIFEPLTSAKCECAASEPIPLFTGS